MSGAPAVCLVLRYFTIGGLERVVIGLANAFVARGVDTRVVVLYTGKRNALITELDPRVDLVLLDGPERARLAALRELTRGRVAHLNFGDGYILDGKLTLKGVTRDVPLTLELNGFGPDPYGGTRAGFTATAEINRRDFGVNFSAVMETGGAVVSDKITLHLEIEAVLQP